MDPFFLWFQTHKLNGLHICYIPLLIPDARILTVLSMTFLNVGPFAHILPKSLSPTWTELLKWSVAEPDKACCQFVTLRFKLSRGVGGRCDAPDLWNVALVKGLECTDGLGQDGKNGVQLAAGLLHVNRGISTNQWINEIKVCPQSQWGSHYSSTPHILRASTEQSRINQNLGTSPRL